MLTSKTRTLLLSACAVAAPLAHAHVANISLSTSAPSFAGDAPDYTVYTPFMSQENGATTYSLQAAIINPIPTDFTGDPDCPYGGYETDPATGEMIPCQYIAAGLDGVVAGGWAQGATKNLGDSHSLLGGLFFTFELNEKSTVTIQFGNDAAYLPADGLPNNLDAAFSLYEHSLPDDSHDDNPFDLLQPTGRNTYYSASRTDQNPLSDPGVQEYFYLAKKDVAIKNPAFTKKVANRYAALYPANGPYRDTQNYTATGGLDSDGTAIGPEPGQSPYLGQFNALGNWSMANDALDPTSADYNPAVFDPIYGSAVVWQTTMNTSTGESATDGTRAIYDPASGDLLWSEIRFLTAVNANTGTATESLSIELQPGIYTIAAGDAGAANGRHYGGVLSVTIK